jgi:hypothetical protein
MPKTNKPHREKVVKVSLNDDEYNILMSKKTRHHLASFIREKALNSTNDTKIISVDPALVRQVGRIGNNLNQIAKYTHEQGEIHAQTAKQIELMRIELKNLIETIKTE